MRNLIFLAERDRVPFRMTSKWLFFVPIKDTDTKRIR